MNKKPGLTKWLWWFSLAAAIILLYKLFSNLSQIGPLLGTVAGILAPFIGGFALAFFLHTPCNWLEGRLLRLRGRVWQKVARPVSLVIVYLGLLGVLALLVYLIIPTLVTSLTSLVKAMPGYLESAKVRLEEFTRPGGLLEDLNLQDKLNEVYQAALALVNKLLTTENILSALRGVLNVTTSLVDVVLSVIVSAYMLAGRERLGRETGQVLGLFVKPARLAVLKDYAHRIGDIFNKYFYGAFLDALVVGIVASIGLLIFRVPYAVAMGMLLGLLNMIPYFGAIIGCVGIVLLTLLSKNIYAALGVAIFVVVVQQVDSNIIQPRIVGGSVGLRPIYVLLGVTVFGGLMGFWGIILGVPLMAVIQMFVKDKIAAKAPKTE